MTPGAALFAGTGLLFAAAACGAGRRRRARSMLCVGASCLCAVAALAWPWAQTRAVVASDAPPDAAWGALWVYTFALLVEWRRSDPAAAGARTLAGILLAGGGMLLLGACLEAWAAAVPPPSLPCGDAGFAIGATAEVRALAALGLALAPLAGVALPFAGAGFPPLSAAAASVAMAAWLRPVLPALEWLPVSVWGGAPLAALLVAVLALVGFAATRGPRATAASLVAYYAVGVGGGLGLGTL